MTLAERLAREAVRWERACHVAFPEAVTNGETKRLYFTDLNIPPAREAAFVQAFREAFAAAIRAALDEAVKAVDACRYKGPIETAPVTVKAANHALRTAAAAIEAL